MGKLTDATLNFTGKSKEEYIFNIYSIDTQFAKKGGVYIFTKRTQGDDGKYNHSSIYCGKTDDLSTRFDNHHKKECIEKNNANCICILENSSENERTKIEEDILKGNNFKCNEILNT